MGFVYCDSNGYRKGKKVASILNCDVDNFIRVIKFDENENEIERKDVAHWNFDDEEKCYDELDDTHGKYYSEFDDIYGKYQFFKDCDVIETHNLYKGALLLGFNIEVKCNMFREYNECEINAVFDLVKELNDQYRSFIK